MDIKTVYVITWIVVTGLSFIMAGVISYVFNKSRYRAHFSYREDDMYCYPLVIGGSAPIINIGVLIVASALFIKRFMEAKRNYDAINAKVDYDEIKLNWHCVDIRKEIDKNA